MTNIKRGLAWRLAMVGASAALALGCGDSDSGGNVASDFDGFWLMSSMTMEFDSSTGEQTLVRGGTPAGLIGDATFEAHDDASATLDVRFGALMNDMPAADFISFLGSIEVESDRWILHNPGDPMDPNDDNTTVLLTSLSGDTLTLTSDPTDPRHDDGGPAEIIMTRRAPWDSELEGSWETALVDGVDYRLCTQAADLNTYDTVHATHEFSDRWWLESDGLVTKYGPIDTDCSAAPLDMLAGFFNGAQWITEIENGTIRSYGFWHDGAMPTPNPQGYYLERTYVPNGADFDFTKVDCAPMSWCDTQADTVRLSPVTP